MGLHPGICLGFAKSLACGLPPLWEACMTCTASGWSGPPYLPGPCALGTRTTKLCSDLHPSGTTLPSCSPYLI